MILNHLLTGFTFGLSLTIISWMVGIIGNAILQNTSYYGKLSDLNFVQSRALNEFLGIEQFKRIVKNSVFRFFNQSIRMDGKRTDLAGIRQRMTQADISHLIGFLFVSTAALYKSLNVSVAFGLTMMIPNAVLNLYPSLLQQENKRRIDQLLTRRAR